MYSHRLSILGVSLHYALPFAAHSVMRNNTHLIWTSTPFRLAAFPADCRIVKPDDHCYVHPGQVLDLILEPLLARYQCQSFRAE